MKKNNKKDFTAQWHKDVVLSKPDHKAWSNQIDSVPYACNANSVNMKGLNRIVGKDNNYTFIGKKIG